MRSKSGRPTFYRQQDLRALTDDGFGIFYGYDICPVESVSMWADGWVCGTGNLFPKENKTVYDLAKAPQDRRGAEVPLRQDSPLFAALYGKDREGPALSVVAGDQGRVEAARSERGRCQKARDGVAG